MSPRIPWPAPEVLERTAIRRLVLEDASGHVMPNSNAENFPAHGNHHGATAGMKIELACDLLAGTIISHSLKAATTQDKTIGSELVVEIRRATSCHETWGTSASASSPPSRLAVPGG